MNLLKKTYRFLAALTLILFTSNILLPAGMAAATLSCDKEMSHTVPACCAKVEMDSHQEKKKNGQDCEKQTFCAQAIDSSLSDIPAVTQSSKIVIATKLLEELTIIRGDSDHPPAARNESASFYHPPIFLLNSTFLN